MKRWRSICSLSLGSHRAPQLVLEASKEAFDIGLRCVFKEALGGIFLPRQPRVGFVEVRVQTRWRSATIQQFWGRWLGLPWTRAEQSSKGQCLSVLTPYNANLFKHWFVILTQCPCGVFGWSHYRLSTQSTNCSGDRHHLFSSLWGRIQCHLEKNRPIWNVMD